ncbi:hypothetical protein BSL78_08087 [Apostichopus japonicus]|uniref:Uncharacterized protein n=1 Tax=Stichopus japonicus TaxID=307972 RepID=A0A2G8L445_STIJA|nr:hypothetical protein BSL78_08087 [Apostichopus japonicus]
MAGHKPHVRYPGQPRYCFRIGETRNEAKSCSDKNDGAAFFLGMIAPLAQEGCVLTLTLTCLYRLSLLCLYEKKVGVKERRQVPTHLLPRRKLHARRGNQVRIHRPPHLVYPPRHCGTQPRVYTASTTSRGEHGISTCFPHQLVQFRPQSGFGTTRSGDRGSCLTATPETR